MYFVFLRAADPAYNNNEGAAADSLYNTLFLNKVVVGNGYQVTFDMPDISQPPYGYDSVRLYGKFTCVAW